MSDVQAVLDALASPVRREILWRIWYDELAVGAIVDAFPLSAPTISGHLAILRGAGLVTVESEGTFRRYRANREALRGLHHLVTMPTKWEPATDIPETQLSTARTTLAVVASVEVPVGRADTFRAFVDPAIYSAWLGVEVTINEGHFSTTMEWGTTIRGRYEHVNAPEMIALKWDFDDDNIPLPGSELRGYMHFLETAAGCRVEVYQIVDTEEQAAFMDLAWTMVLGRLREGVVAALATGAPARPRVRRSKRN